MHLPGLATFRFDSQSCNVTAFVDSPDCPDSVLDAFRRAVLPMALQARGLEVLHASAVRTPRGVLALCAVAETGKSTLACGLSQRGPRCLRPGGARSGFRSPVSGRTR